MKIAVVIDLSSRGGGNIFVRKLHNFLSKKDWDVEILTNDDSLNTKRISFSKKGGAFRLLGILRARREIRQELGRISPDVVLILSPVAALTTMNAWGEDREFKTVYAPRYLALDQWDEIEGGLSGRVKKFIEKKALNLDYDLVFALNEDMKERMKEAGVGVPIKVVPIGVDTEKFSPRPMNSESSKILFVGRFEPVKGVNVFLEASKRVEGADFLMLGDKKEKLDKIPESVSVKEWVPHRRMVEFYNEACVVAVPSYTEGLPRVCLEALACGTPVVASNVGVIPELVLDGETGFLIEPGNAEELAENIRKLLGDLGLAKRMGRRGRTHIVENFSEEEAMRKTLKEIKEAAEDY